MRMMATVEMKVMVTLNLCSYELINQFKGKISSAYLIVVYMFPDPGSNQC